MSTLYRAGVVVGTVLVLAGVGGLAAGQYDRLTDDCEPGTYLSVTEAPAPDGDPVPYASLSPVERRAFTDAVRGDAAPLSSYDGRVDLPEYVRYGNATYDVERGALECGNTALLLTLAGGVGVALGGGIIALTVAGRRALAAASGEGG